jgi:hypothetical protein
MLPKESMGMWTAGVRFGEYDHIQDMGLPGGIPSLLNHVTENMQEARKAATHLAKRYDYPAMLPATDPGG